MDHLMKDASLKQTRALPSGAATVNSSAIDLVTSSRANNLGLELLISAPALAVGQLANASTMKYKLQHDTDSAFGTAENLCGIETIVQTGAGGVGAAAATKRVALPSDCKRYVRLVVTNSAAADASAATATLELVGSALC
jgi:hypothetical protein